jgi:hypothetical protein
MEDLGETKTNEMYRMSPIKPQKNFEKIRQNYQVKISSPKPSCENSKSSLNVYSNYHNSKHFLEKYGEKNFEGEKSQREKNVRGKIEGEKSKGENGIGVKIMLKGISKKSSNQFSKKDSSDSSSYQVINYQQLLKKKSPETDPPLSTPPLSTGKKFEDSTSSKNPGNLRSVRQKKSPSQERNQVNEVPNQIKSKNFGSKPSRGSKANEQLKESMPESNSKNGQESEYSESQSIQMSEQKQSLR